MMKPLLLALPLMFILFACDPPPDPYARPAPRPVAEKTEPVIEEAPFAPPMDLPPDEETRGLPAYMRPRESRFSRTMWRRIQDAHDEMVALRRSLHAAPELAHREVNTSRMLAQQLEPLGFKLIGPVGLTGFAALLDGGEGPTVAVVTGMDGVPVAEDTRLPFASRAEGYWEGQKVPVSHAFGRDVEMAIAVGTAKLLVSMKESIPGKVVFIFQPASGRLQAGDSPGARDVLASGVLSRLGVEVLFTLPLDPGLPVGRVGVPTGAVAGGLTRFSIVVQGTQNRICSGTVPWMCVDPIAIASHLVQELLLLPSRQFGPNRQVVLNVGRIEGGDADHTVASSVTISGTFRWLVESDARRMQQLISRVTDGAGRMAGTSIRTTFEKGPQNQVGHSEVLYWALPTLVRSLGRRGVMPGDPLAEPGDFPLYQKEVPTAMFLLGCGRTNRDAGRRGEGTFSPDEETLTVGVHVLSNLIVDYLHDANRPKLAPARKTKAVDAEGVR